MKAVTAFGDEEPSHMDQARKANRDFPAIAFKPGEFSRGWPGGAAPIGRSKTADIITASERVGTSVAIGAFLRRLLIRMGHSVAAAPAKDQFILSPFRFALDRLIRMFARFSRNRFLSRQAKPVEDIAVGRIHGRIIP